MAKVAIITGSSRGIGAACALEFAKKGYKLALQGRDTGKLADIKEQCLKNGSPGVLTIALDLSETQKLETLIQKTVTEFGRIDVLGLPRNKIYFNFPWTALFQSFRCSVKSIMQVRCAQEDLKIKLAKILIL